MLKSRINILVLITLVVALAGPLFGQTIPPAGSEGKLIAVLKSDASHKEKADACRHLAIIGTKKAVAPLAALLSDEKLSHMARYGLEPNPDPAVDKFFRGSLGKLKGRPLVGVIGSIGVRRDVKAVRQLSLLLRNSDAEVSHAAARALGKIGNTAAAVAISRIVEDAPAANQLALCEGLFRCAESLAAEGQRSFATKFYDQLRSLKAAHQVRGGALRGAIVTRGKDGLALLREYLQSKDYIMFSAAVQASQEMKGSEVTKALTDGLEGLPVDNQILIIHALGERGDGSATNTLYALAKSGEKPVRLAAIRSIPEFHTSGLQLRELFNDSDSDISKAAKESFGAMHSGEADAAVMAMFRSSDTDKQLTALDLMGRRRMTESVPVLLEAARDADPKVHREVFRKIGELGGPEQLPSLLKLLMDANDPQSTARAGQAVIAVCMKADNPESLTVKFTDLMAESNPYQKSSLVRILGVIGGPKALEAVLAAVDDSNYRVRGTAIRSLSTWKNTNAAPHLLELAKTQTNKGAKTVCLRAYLSMASRTSMPGDKRLSMCRQAKGLVERDDEKKLLLGALGNIDSTDALAMVMPYLDEPATRQEASMASLAISERLLKGRGASRVASKLIKPLEKVAKVTTDAKTAQRAKGLLKQAQSKAK